jgi:hypothetical protein
MIAEKIRRQAQKNSLRLGGLDTLVVGALNVMEPSRYGIDLLPKEAQIYQWGVEIDASKRNEFEKHGPPAVTKIKWGV